jgi:hypothetical protein
MYEAAISRFSASSETLKNFSAQFRRIRAQIAVARAFMFAMIQQVWPLGSRTRCIPAKAAKVIPFAAA